MRPAPKKLDRSWTVSDVMLRDRIAWAAGKARRDPMCSRARRERPWSPANIMTRAVERRRHTLGLEAFF